MDDYHMIDIGLKIVYSCGIIGLGLMAFIGTIFIIDKITPKRPKMIMVLVTLTIFLLTITAVYQTIY